VGFGLRIRFRGERYGEENQIGMKDTGDRRFGLWGGFCNSSWIFPPGREC